MTKLSKEEYYEVMNYIQDEGKPLSQALKEKANTIIVECGCSCHKPGIISMHIMDCCQLSCEHPL